ncbi:sulfurtransferase TusA family protein [Moorella sp. Hama-1]|uniref:sulfurtransferase TusA family protein n=1 Tax=Moorella sp. Hama-1 TaxID=2138101 RepID=UPI000D65DFBB|nr:sulfurtransferase TusA family protein [Moorella sp. Hama-1]BCV22403.1 transcriptional regulator [Moorella sp. Hama-1]
MGEIRATKRLDITGDCCPITFVKTKLALEEMQPGEILEVLLKEGDPLVNVPRSLKSEGHRVLQVKKVRPDTYLLIVERGKLE